MVAVTRAPRLAGLALVGGVAVACGGKAAAPEARQDARPAPKAGSAEPVHAGSDAGGGSATAKAAPSPRGDAQVRVTWTSPPATLRAPGRPTACGRARAPALAPTSTWGIPDVAVWVDVAPIVAAPAAIVRVAVAPCAVTPAVAVTHPDGALDVVSELPSPGAARVTHYGDPETPTAQRAHIDSDDRPASAETPVLLPVIGHAARLPLAAPALDEVTGPDASAAAWVVTTRGAAGVTDAGGQVVLHDLPVGAHAVTAWWPPHGEVPARTAHGRVEVLPGGLAEVTLELGSGAGAP